LSEVLGNPSVMFVDVWPTSAPILVIRDPGVAEQVSKSSKLFPYSVPKSPDTDNMYEMIGGSSILRVEVCSISVLLKFLNACGLTVA
jgi:hypothetical protein